MRHNRVLQITPDPVRHLQLCGSCRRRARGRRTLADAGSAILIGLALALVVVSMAATIWGQR